MVPAISDNVPRLDASRDIYLNAIAKPVYSQIYRFLYYGEKSTARVKPVLCVRATL